MKHRRLVTALLAGILLVTVSSCQKEVIVNGNQYATTSHQYTVHANQWSQYTTDGRNQLIATFSDEDITQDIFENGTVTAAVWCTYDSRSSAGSWNPLPYLYPFFWEEEGESGVLTENIRFEYEQGKVTFVIEDMDGIMPYAMVDDITFKVTTVQ